MKNILREKIMQSRNSLSNEEILSRSKKIEKNLFSLNEFKNAKTIMLFVSFDSEVYTHDMIKDILKSKKNIAVPKVVEHEIHPSLIIDFDQLIPSGIFGILEPIELLKINLKNIDVVIIPGIVFDKTGHRIGYGYGFYDKFLRKIPKALKIGVAYDFQIIEKIPNDAHDVPVDIVVTDKEIIFV